MREPNGLTHIDRSYFDEIVPLDEAPSSARVRAMKTGHLFQSDQSKSS
jgi:hypothetical protein